MESEIIFFHKAIINKRYMLELKIRQFMGKNEKYPDALKYNLIFLDLKTDKKILFDNHPPKGHHYHIGEKEFDYEFKDEEKLISDFKTLVLNRFGVII